MKVGGINKLLHYFLGVLLLVCILSISFVVVKSVYVYAKNKKSEQEISIGDKYIFYDIVSPTVDYMEEPYEKNPFNRFNDTVIIIDNLDGYVKYRRNVYENEINEFYDENYNYPHKWVESMSIKKFKNFVKKI